VDAEESAAQRRRLARSEFRARMRGELEGDAAAAAGFDEDWRPVLAAIADRDRADEPDEPGVAGVVNL